MQQFCLSGLILAELVVLTGEKRANSVDSNPDFGQVLPLCLSDHILAVLAVLMGTRVRTKRTATQAVARCMSCLLSCAELCVACMTLWQPRGAEQQQGCTSE